jgi:hypothetical protein
LESIHCFWVVKGGNYIRNGFLIPVISVSLKIGVWEEIDSMHGA